MKRSLLMMSIVAWILVIVFIIIVGAIGISAASNLLKEEKISVQDVNSIILQNDRKSIEIVVTDAEQARVCQYGRSDTDLFTVNIVDGCATINSKNEFKLFDLWTLDEKLVIEMPASWTGNVEINSSSGGISIKDRFSWKDVKLNCTSGAINIAGELAAQNLDISNSSGRISVDGEVTVGGKLNAENTSGGINFSKPIKAGDVNMKTSSGKIKLDEVKTSGLKLSNSSGGISLGEVKTSSFSLTNTSGSIDVAGITGAGNIRNTSGGINVKLNDPVGKVDLSSKSGSIKISVDESLSFNFNGECTSGTVKANFPLEKNNDGNKACATIGGDPAATITAKATSGGININRE